MAPILKAVKLEIRNAATIIKVDVDKNQQAAGEYQVQGFLTLILLKNGKPLWRQSRIVQKTAIAGVIRKFTL